MILSWYMNQEQSFPSFSFACSTILNRNRACNLLDSYQGPVGKLYLQYILPLSLFPSLLFLLAVILQQANPSALPIVVVSLALTFAISFALLHFWSLIIEGLLVAQGIEISRLTAVKITMLAGSPWFIIFALFPAIQGGVILGLVWVVSLLPLALTRIGLVPKEKLNRIFISSSLLWIASYLFSNLFFIGVLSIAGMM